MAGVDDARADRLRVMMLAGLTQGNDRRADCNLRLLDDRGAVAVNFIGSPGSGKTTVLAATVAELGGRIPFAVIDGDLETSRDGLRLAQLDVPVVQINTQGACHLDAAMVGRALAELPVGTGTAVLIENVGNLVCPAGFRLGERLRVVLLSVAEGSDKVAKYPATFRSADCVLINKADLLPYVEFDLAAVEGDLREIGARATVILVSARTGHGLADWTAWLQGNLTRCRAEGGRC